MSAGGRSYTDAEILAFPRMSWLEYVAREGLPASGVRPAGQRIERGPSVARRKPVRDYLSEPLSELIDWRL
jgi:hypothetical protein